MSIEIDTLNGSDTLANLEKTIIQTEQLGYELISFAKGIVDSKPANIATFHLIAAGKLPGTLSLVIESGSNTLEQQGSDLENGETGAKILISYAAVFVGGQEVNVAAYRG